MAEAPAFLQRVDRRAKGDFVINGPLLPGQVAEGETLMCVHCQKHWRVRPGSGMQRGWCGRCGGPTCGKKACETRCTPFEKAIEMMEARGRLLEKAAEALRQ
jgi:hypothetical protein